MGIYFHSKDLPSSQLKAHVLEGIAKFYGLSMVGVRRVVVAIDADDCNVTLELSPGFPKQQGAKEESK